ncbi:MAG: GNAT family N-acetyltransferase [Pseudomonadota bacterium]
MREAKAGETVHVVVTYLAMNRPPDYPWPPAPAGPPLALLHAVDPPPWYFLNLYDAVGSGHEWTDWHAASPDELADYVGNPQIELYTLMRTGWPAGMFMLDFRTAGSCGLAYFGLVPEMIGRGLGGWLLRTAVHMGWDRDGVAAMAVNTCTLDHPTALPLYQKVGFRPVRRETRSHILSRDRSLP